ncbi:MAG: PH domain-containing protein [Bacilli bacterium]|nr:PH domain-containing protein [Bacilli bacterium]
MQEVIEKALEFKKRHPMTVAWRIKANAKLVGSYISPEEDIKYVFIGQKNDFFYDILSTNVAVITNKRIIVGTKRVLFGHFITSITPDLFNDLKIKAGMFWGKVYIDTVGELVIFSNIDKGALDEIESQVTEHIIREKKKYPKREAR